MTIPTIRPELEPLPVHLRRLPLDVRGYPVPWFVPWVDGVPEFRAMDAEKYRRAVQERRCWVCGDILGKWLTFVIGPMCAINRTTAEPPCHTDCAEWSARNCPLLSRPHMVRREDEAVNAELLAASSPGVALLRNPGVTLLWTTRRYRRFNAGRDKWLIEIGDPDTVSWYAHGRPATRAEVAASIDSGLPLLEEAVAQEATAERRAEAHADLARRRVAVEALYPVEEVLT